MITLGQQRAKAQLSRLYHSSRVPHALLMLGQTGWGTLALAVEFAQWLQCQGDPTGSTGPCGECNACRKAAQFIHPDIHFSYPTIGTNAVSTNFIKEWRTALQENPWQDANAWLQRLGAENKQGNITKDECNAIIKKLSLKTFEGRYKILIMWLPEYLGKEGNRLLKLIEEPPEQTVFLLVAENADLILPTILSRCQLVKTDPLTDAEIALGLQEVRNLDADRSRQIAFLAGGDFNQALELADNPENDDAALLLDWLRKCWKGNGVELVRWTEQFAKLGRENQKQFLQYGLHFLRELLAMIVAQKNDARLRPDELQTARNMARVLNFDKITQLVQILTDNVYYIERNANPKILFLDSSIQINRILKEAS
ncbi:MAG: DNA polymerase III subunit [Bacteroidetes bacterium]|nr:MAG: DNA polymerase III subunit [Bacteroidota bacterium]